MTARTHDAFALASLVTIAAFYQPENLNLTTFVAAIIVADVGSIIPDMDQASNKLWDLLPAGDQLGKIFRRIFLGHRTLSHSLLGVFVIYKLLKWLPFKVLNPSFIDPKIIFISVVIGYISHLVLDGFTKEGLPLLFPLRINFGIPLLKSLRIKAGTWIENIIVYPAIWIYLIWFINANKDKLIKVIELIGS